jgi:hypothetical protein
MIVFLLQEEDMFINNLLRRAFLGITTTVFLSAICTGLAYAAPDARTLLKESESRHRTKTQQYAGNLTV